MELQSAFGSAQQALKTFYKGMTDDMQMCILNCMQCSQVCEHMVQHCLKKGGLHAEPAHIRLLMDCAEICQISASFMNRESKFHHLTCASCSEICVSCAEDCERLGDDEMMQMCADICRRCAETCRNMALHH